MRCLRELDWAANGFDLAKVAGELGDESDAADLISLLRTPKPTATIVFGRRF